VRRGRPRALGLANLGGRPLSCQGRLSK